MSRYDVKQEVTDKYSLRGRVFHKLREDILNGKYKENEELKEVAIRRGAWCIQNSCQRSLSSVGA